MALEVMLSCKSPTRRTKRRPLLNLATHNQVFTIQTRKTNFLLYCQRSSRPALQYLHRSLIDFYKAVKTIHKIHVWHEGTGSWNLESVRLQHQEEDPIFFDIQEKLPSGHIVERAPIHDDTAVQVNYDVSCVAGSTTVLPFINIIGSMGHTRFRPFDPTKTSTIKAISIGEISELQLKFVGDEGTWPLEKIEIATKVSRKVSYLNRKVHSQQSNGSILREVFKTQYNQRAINTSNTVSLTPCKVECLYKGIIL